MSTNYSKHPIRLICPIRDYAWGRTAAKSILPSLSESEFPDDALFAELWAGAHPTAPALFLEEGKERRLDEVIKAEPEVILGREVCKKFGDTLPFLFKILSIRTALSIQAHPDKALACELHAADSKNYPDKNHKPETAIALSPVRFLYGFRTPAEIRRFLTLVPELASLSNEELDDRIQGAGSDPKAQTLLVREFYQQIMTRDDADVRQACVQMFKRLRVKANEESLLDEERWVLDLEGDYPEGDVGLFSFFVLNLMRLEPGGAVFIGPNIPHAYLDGELVECMSNSDNVVRAGLTSKYKDLTTLLKMSDYSKGRPDYIDSQSSADGVPWKEFSVPVEEFAISELTEPVESLACANKSKVELLFCLEGKGELHYAESVASLTPGACYLIPAECEGYAVSLKEGRLFRVRVPI